MLDVKDGFINIPLHDNKKMYFRFLVVGRLYQYCRLMQGFNGSKSIFHSLLGRIIIELGFIKICGPIMKQKSSEDKVEFIHEDMEYSKGYGVGL